MTYVILPYSSICLLNSVLTFQVDHINSRLYKRPINQIHDMDDEDISRFSDSINCSQNHLVALNGITAEIHFRIYCQHLECFSI